MGTIKILTVNRNEGAISQRYRIEYKLSTDSIWLSGPTLNYNQAQPIPLGVLPIQIITPSSWNSGVINVRIVTLCDAVEMPGPQIDLIVIINQSPIRAYWGYFVTYGGVPIDGAGIVASNLFMDILHNDPITADFSSNGTTPAYLWFAYPVNEEIKNMYQDTIVQFNSGPIISPNDLMDVPQIIDGFYLHVTNYLTSAINPIRFSHV